MQLENLLGMLPLAIVNSIQYRELNSVLRYIRNSLKYPILSSGIVGGNLCIVQNFNVCCIRTYMTT